jgi:hypothetical protein
MTNIDWEHVRVDAAISAMQGIMESGKLGQILEAAPDMVAKQAVKMADALISELRKRGCPNKCDNATLKQD